MLETSAEIARPGLRAVHHGTLLRTNSLGFRGPEHAARPPGDTFRIAVTGDSVTMGHGVEEEEAYPKQLEHCSSPEATRAAMKFSTSACPEPRSPTACGV